MIIPESYKRPKPKVVDEDFWIDPDDSREPGLLLSDRILFYCEKVNLIFPNDPVFVEPASYTLHAGREYLVSTRPGKVENRNLEEAGRVVIPPNGLIYIRFIEEVNIPHYMIARFNLRVTQVYRGLLLGTGPQVDPGFRGHLGCPIHNFTDEDKSIELFEPLGTIDFEKTTRLGETFFTGKDPKDIVTKEHAGMRSGTIQVTGINGLQCKIFNKRSGASFQSYLPGGESVRSSVAALNEDVKKAQRQIAIYRTVAISGLLVLVFAAFTLYTNLKDDISNRYMDLKNNIVEMSKSIGRLESSIQSNVTTAPLERHPQKEDKPPPATKEDVGSNRPAGKPVQ